MTSEFGLVALLPMKAHSERISGKNFREFAGKPLFRWMLDRLLATDEIDRVVINTDAREILRSHGVEESEKLCIRDRSESLCGDMVSMNAILQDDLRSIASRMYLMTHTTNPLLSVDTMRRGIEAYRRGLNDGRCDSLFSVTKYQSRFYSDHGEALNHDPGKLLRTQDLPPLFEENSNLYLFNRDSFESSQARIGRRPMMFETPFLESFDIDDADGWNLAEVVAKDHIRQASTTSATDAVRQSPTQA